MRHRLNVTLSDADLFHELKRLAQENGRRLDDEATEAVRAWVTKPKRNTKEKQ